MELQSGFTAEEPLPTSTMNINTTEPNEIFAILKENAPPATEQRATYLKVGAIESSKGSAYMEYGQTKVTAVVEALQEQSKSSYTNNCDVLGEIVCTVKFADFATRDNDVIAHKESCYSTMLKRALQPMICRHGFANFEMEIKCIVLDDDGCVLSTAINCCGAALVDAGVHIYGLITASTVSIYRDHVFMDPDRNVEYLLSSACNKDDADSDYGTVVIAILNDLGQVAVCFQTGFLTLETLNTLSQKAIQHNLKMFEIIGSVLKRKHKLDRESLIKKSN